MAVKTFDPDKLAISIGGNLITGFAEGSFVKVSRDTDSFNLTVGSDGEATRVKTNNKAGTVVITLQQSSASNDILSALAASDELSNGGAVPLLVKDNSGRSLYSAETAWVQKYADAEYSNDVTDREWTIRTDALAFFVGGN
jgi:hypothetical protein